MKLNPQMKPIADAFDKLHVRYERLEAENAQLREALADARNWVKSLSRQNGSGHWDLVKESPRFKRLEAALKETDQ